MQKEADVQESGISIPSESPWAAGLVSLPLTTQQLWEIHFILKTSVFLRVKLRH